MALLRGKLSLGRGFGLNLSEKGVSPYFTTPLGPVNAGLTTIPTQFKGIRFSIGKNPANLLISAARRIGWPPKPPKKPSPRGPLR